MSNFKTYVCFLIVIMHLITVFMFSAFNLSMFAEVDGTVIDNEDRK